MNNKNIKQIIKELYLIDPELKKHEDDLIKIIKKLIKSKPDTKFDIHFAQKLKNDLLKKKKKKSFFDLNNFNFMKKLYYVPAGIIVLAILIIPSIYYFSQFKNQNNISGLASLSLEEKEKNAFGPLGVVAHDLLQKNNMPAGAGGMGGFGASENLMLDDKERMKMIGMPNPFSANFAFTYVGENLAMASEEIKILKRKKQGLLQKNISQNFSQFSLDLLDLEKFKNQNITNLSISEDKEFGYNIYFDFKNDQISINQNWEKWPRLDMGCQTFSNSEEINKCLEKNRLKIDDVPSDEKIIKIANNFLDKYNINTDNYGEAKILDSWRRGYEQAQTRELKYYVPESIPVVFPLKIEEKTVYSEGGEETGITIEVNIRHMKVSGARNIMPAAFESSSYEGETDLEKIIKIAEEGGYRGIFQNPNAKVKKEIKLGTPSLELVSLWKFDNDKMAGQELLVPAYIFPVLEFPIETYFGYKNIIVPAAKELLDELENNETKDLPRPMPLLENSQAESLEPKTETLEK